MKELMEAKALIKKHLSPHTAPPDDWYWGGYGFCPVCKRSDIQGILLHEETCYWHKMGKRHVQGNRIGQDRDPEYGQAYDRYEWIEEDICWKK